jgi:hypothetical protein
LHQVYRIFLLSPAHCDGKRAAMLLAPTAEFTLAAALRNGGAPLADVFSFLSGLYFRGKIAYARAFAQPPEGIDGAFVITSCRGLRSPDERIDGTTVREFAAVPIDATEQRYHRPLAFDARALAEAAGHDCEVVLLGSIATPKYSSIFQATFGDRLRFPRDFVGRGDMSRGAMMLRAVAEGRELVYAPLDGAQIHGPRAVPLTGRSA